MWIFPNILGTEGAVEARNNLMLQPEIAPNFSTTFRKTWNFIETRVELRELAKPKKLSTPARGCTLLQHTFQRKVMIFQEKIIGTEGAVEARNNVMFQPEIAPNFCTLFDEKVRFYRNSFRTEGAGEAKKT